MGLCIAWSLGPVLSPERSRWQRSLGEELARGGRTGAPMVAKSLGS